MFKDSEGQQTGGRHLSMNERVMKALQRSFDLTWQRRGSWERDLVRGVSMAKVEIAFVVS